eukprot:TRINITY_DN4005_c0_g1_i3.p1 TRINITY_DN4005_c0_g1~~TRINITY_DN4005_c0_g1_i3.p1  ORF type:complete len:451 (+),score=64.01 TRINITY_DN4005_c0_g1_i3:256-1608(+)
MARGRVLAPLGGKNDAGMEIFVVIFVALLCIGFAAASAGLNCTSEGEICQSLVVFHPQPDLNVSTIQALFGAVNYWVSDPGDRDSKWLIPVNCSCVNGNYLSVVGYTVKPGDYLSLIATYYQNLTTWQKIHEVSQLENADVISPGDALKVPIPCGCMGNATNITYVTYGKQVGDTADSIADAMNLNTSNGVEEAMEADVNNTVLVFPLTIAATEPNEPAISATEPNEPAISATEPNEPAISETEPNEPECSSPSDSCNSLIVFHPEPTQNITWISRLYGNKERIAEQNRDIDTAANWFIPVQCSCSNGTYRSLTNYTVMNGDDLSKIATYYQNLTTWQGLHAVNPRKDPNTVQVNEILNVSIPCKCSDGKTFVTYGWQKGDTTEKVAAATNATVPDVQEAEKRANETGMGFLVFPTSRQVVSLSGDSMAWSPSVLMIIIQFPSVIAWLIL